jgi:hypothetical protein
MVPATKLPSIALRRRTLSAAIRSVLLGCALAALPGSGTQFAAAATVDTPVCHSHMEKIALIATSAEQSLAAARDQDLAGQCAALHSHVRLMLEARNIYSRCTTGSERVEKLGNAADAIDTSSELISSRCVTATASAH